MRRALLLLTVSAALFGSDQTQHVKVKAIKYLGERMPSYWFVGMRMDVGNIVQLDDKWYGLDCHANWVGSHCGDLIVGNTFDADLKGNTMWIHGFVGKKAFKMKTTVMATGPVPSEVEK